MVDPESSRRPKRLSALGQPVFVTVSSAPPSPGRVRRGGSKPAPGVARARSSTRPRGSVIPPRRTGRRDERGWVAAGGPVLTLEPRIVSRNTRGKPEPGLPLPTPPRRLYLGPSRGGAARRGPGGPGHRSSFGGPTVTVPTGVEAPCRTPEVRRAGRAGLGRGEAGRARGGFTPEGLFSTLRADPNLFLPGVV